MITIEYVPNCGKWDYIVTTEGVKERMLGFGYPSKRVAKRCANDILKDLRKKHTIRVKR
jgi:hypothetical protein